ncbi:unnamed protein product [Chironomus riparius]|uniref:Uncharacterized protein n=1 Tax=Chironomus riparius TaxID=315576 RepID=A0A9N9S128_9DIPT|nr:unnamed protein product [Chironomus riparius]
MKILTSLLLICLLADSIISIPFASDEYFEEVIGSSEEIRVTSTLATTSTTTEISTTTSTTVAPLPLISPEVEELIESVSTRFNELKSKFLEHQKNIYEKVEMDLDNHKALRDSSIKIFKDAYDHEITDLDNNLKTIETKKSTVQKFIEKFLDNSWEKEKDEKRVEKLKERNKLLLSMKTGNCDDCDGFLDDDQIDLLLEKNDKQIAELKEKIKKQENESEIRRTRLNADETRQLNAKYLDLIHIFQKEVEERKKKDKLELISTVINDKWKNYAEKIGDLHAKVTGKLDTLTKNTLKLSKLTSNESFYTSDDDWEEFEISSNAFKWIAFSKSNNIPTDAVSAGEDTDGSNLYIIRSKKDDSYLYGKLASSSSRKDAYVTNNDVEITPSSFELLTFKNYTWCDTKTYKIRENTPSVCTTTHYYEPSWSFARKEIKLPGTLLKDGKCRIGFGWKVHTYSENVKVLGLGSCKIADASTGDLKFWF